MTLTCISPLRRAVPLSFPVQKGCCFKQWSHLNRQEIVFLAKINASMDHIFTVGLGMPNLMTGISSHTSTHPCADYISASKSREKDAPIRLLNFYARELGKWMKTWRKFLSCSKLDSTSPVLLLSPPPFPPPPPLALKFELVNL